MPRYGVFTDTSAAAADFEARMAAQSAASLPVFNVKANTYGATGNGVTDDRPAIQAAITAAVAAGGGIVWIPAGTFFLNSYAPTYTDRILRVDGGSGAYITVAVLGAPGAVLTTPLCPAAAQVNTIMLEGNLESPLVEGIEFRNTHGATTSTTVAIGIAGGSTQKVKRATIRRNVFKNHARTLSMGGVEGLTVENNSFLFSNGHDSGNTSGGGPNVGLWCYGDTASNAPASDVRVIGNFFDGCTSGDVSANTVKTGMDGFVYGESRGWTIIGNIIKRFGYEGIYVRNRECAASDTTRYPCVISGNIIDAKPVTGDVTYAQTGIRCDEYDATISGNSIVNAARGILGGPMVECPGIGVTRQLITGNSIEMLDGALGSSYYGVELLLPTDCSVTNNVIRWKTAVAGAASGVQGVLLSDAVRTRVAGNSIRLGTNPGGYTATGIFFQGNATADCTAENNEIDNVDQAFWSAANMLTTSVVAVGRNTYRRCLAYFTGNVGSFIDASGISDTVVEYPGVNSFTLQAHVNRIKQHITGVLTGNQTVTLSTTNAIHGKTFQITRRATGAFTVDVGGLKTIPAGTLARVDVVYDRAAGWMLDGYQLL